MSARDDLERLKQADQAEPMKPMEPEPFEHDIEPTPWPADCLPGLMQQAAEAIAEHVQVPEALAGFAVLSAVAHVAQRIADAARPGLSPCPSSLYLLALADSGDRKSTAFSAASKPVTKAEIEARQRHKLVAASDPDSKPQDPRTIYVDSTLQRITSDMVKGSRPALSWSTDEGAQFFGGHTLKSDTRGEALGTLTRLYDGSGVQRDRVGQESVSGARFGVRLGVFMAAQQVAVAPSLHDPLLRGQGLLPRFLLAAPPSLAGQRFMTGDSDGSGLDADRRMGNYWATLKRMNDHPEATDEHGGLSLPVATLTPDAARCWIDFYNLTESRLDPYSGDLIEGLKPFGSRAAENVARVAAVFAAWRYFEAGGEALTVTGDDMARACRLVDYSLSEWQRLSERTTLSAKERDARDLLLFLQRDPTKWGRFTKTDAATKGYGPLRKDKNRRNAALDELVQRHWLAFDGTAFALAKPGNPPRANANSANPANSGQAGRGEISKISTISISKPPEPDFAEPLQLAANEIEHEPLPSYLPPLDATTAAAPRAIDQSDKEWVSSFDAEEARLTGTDDWGEF